MESNSVSVIHDCIDLGVYAAIPLICLVASLLVRHTTLVFSLASVSFLEIFTFQVSTIGDYGLWRYEYGSAACKEIVNISGSTVGVWYFLILMLVAWASAIIAHFRRPNRIPMFRPKQTNGKGGCEYFGSGT